MPTYNNPGEKTINIHELGIALNPGVTQNLISIPDKYLTKYSNKFDVSLTLVDNKPFYNPIISDVIVNLDKEDSTSEVIIDTAKCKTIQVVEASAYTFCYINDINNTPPIRIRINETTFIKNEVTINKLIFKATIGCTLQVIQLINKLPEQDWTKSVSLETINNF